MALFLPRVGMSAQVSTASLRGTVESRTGGPLPETMILVKNPETERSHTAESNAAGQFEFLQLDPGMYEVQASRPGYVTQTWKDVELAAGRQEILQLALAQESETPQGATADSGSGPAAPPSATTVTQIDQSQLVGLPLNGRSYSQLATLQAGVTDPSAASGSRGVGGGNLTVAGGRSASNVFLLDGTNIMDARNQVPRSAAGVQLGSDAVIEVRVFSTNYGPEYGRGSGGILNSITKSGTPEFHGTFFEFLRNSKLDAKNFFDPATEPIPPFKRNQFGFTLTGPVVKDRTFLMGSFEALRDRLTLTNIDFFPDEQARRGMITDERGEIIKTVSLHPRIPEYLELYPVPNAGRVGTGIGRNVASQFLPTNEAFFTVRLDHQLTERDSFFARYTFDDAHERGCAGHVFVQLAHQYASAVFDPGGESYFQSRRVDLAPGGVHAAGGDKRDDFLAGNSEPAVFRARRATVRNDRDSRLERVGAEPRHPGRQHHEHVSVRRRCDRAKRASHAEDGSRSSPLPLGPLLQLASGGAMGLQQSGGFSPGRDERNQPGGGIAGRGQPEGVPGRPSWACIFRTRMRCVPTCD